MPTVKFFHQRVNTAWNFEFTPWKVQFTHRDREKISRFSVKSISPLFTWRVTYNLFFPFSFFFFTTQVEQFWGFYSYLVRPGDLTGHSDIHLFKDGIKPMWEVGYLFESFKKMEHLPEETEFYKYFISLNNNLPPKKYSVFRVTWLYSSCYTTKKNWRDHSALNLWNPG